MGWLAGLSLKAWLWTMGGAAVVIAGLLVALALQGAAATKAKAAVTVARSERDQAVQSIAGHKAAAERCNAGVAQLKQESAEKVATANAALAALRAENARYKESDRRLTRLSAGPTPSGARCAEAIQAIRKELKK